MREDDRGRDGLRHQSGYVFCPRHGAVAIINAIERPDRSGSMRTVLWCSLRGAAQWCAEDCGAPGAEDCGASIVRAAGAAPAEAVGR
jgi:hypothetical protein